MKYQMLAVALIAAFSIVVLSQTSEAGGRKGGGDWLGNGTTLTGLEGGTASGSSSVTIREIELPSAR